MGFGALEPILRRYGIGSGFGLDFGPAFGPKLGPNHMSESECPNQNVRIRISESECPNRILIDFGADLSATDPAAGSTGPTGRARGKTMTARAGATVGES